MPSKIEIAKALLKKIANVDDAVKLVGKDRAEYLKALDEVYGPRAKRAKDLGFSDTIYYHGTKSKVPIDEFSLEKAQAGTTLGKGVYTSSNTKIPDAYGDKLGGSVYPLRISGKLEKADKKLSKTDIQAFKNNVDPEVFKYLKSNLDLEPGNKLGNSFRRASWESQEYQKEDPLKKIADELGFTGLDSEPRETVVYDPKNIRSVNAAFDPRFKDSAKIMAGVGAMPLMASEKPQMKSPTEYLGDLLGKYNEAKDAVAGRVAKQIDISKDPGTQDTIKNLLSFGADPLNMVGGAAGVGLNAAMMMADDSAEKKKQAIIELRKQMNGR